MLADVGVGAADELLERVTLARDDEILEVDRARIVPVLVENIERGDVVVPPGLTHQLAHRAADAQTALDGDEVVRHAAADLIVRVSLQARNVRLRAAVEQSRDGALFLRRETLEHVERVVRVHAGDDLRRERDGQLTDVRGRILEIGEDVSERVRVERSDDASALGGREVRQRLGDVVLVVVREERSQLRGPLRAADGAHQLDRVILLKKQILLHVVSSFRPKMGIKIHRVKMIATARHLMRRERGTQRSGMWLLHVHGRPHSAPI